MTQRGTVIGGLMALGLAMVLSGCGSTPSFRDSYAQTVPYTVPSRMADAPLALTEEIDLSARGEGDVVTIEFYKSDTERFRTEDGFCFLSMVNGFSSNGNWARVGTDARGWFFRVRSTGDAVSASARCVAL